MTNKRLDNIRMHGTTVKKKKVVVDGAGTSETYFPGQSKSKRNAIYRRIKGILGIATYISILIL